MSVNYIIEINALDDWELTHSLSATAYKVMRKLQYLANKERFPERISVANTVLMSLVGCSEDSLIKARNQLIQSGLIEYKGQKKITPVYTICYFSHNQIYNSKMQSYEQGIEQGIKQSYEQGIEQGIKQGTYNKQNKENGEEEESAARYFVRRGIPLAGTQYEALQEFYEQGITDDMLRFAADEAVEYGALSFAYIRRVVDSWICYGVKTLEEAKKRQTQFKKAQEESRSLSRNSAQQTLTQQQPAPKFFAERWGE